MAAEPTFPGRRAAEARRYGLNCLRLTAEALEQWGFPQAMIVPLEHVDDHRAEEGALLRSASEVAARLTTEDYDTVPIVRVSCGRLGEDDVVPVLDTVRADAAELRRAMLAGRPAHSSDSLRRQSAGRGRAPPPEGERGSVVPRVRQAYGAPSGSTVG